MHRLRGVLGTAITWALIWLPIGVVTALLPQRRVECIYCAPFWEWFPRFALMWILWGAVSGGIFAIVLMFAERRRSLLELATARVALWGAVGSLALPGALMVRDDFVRGVLIE